MRLCVFYFGWVFLKIKCGWGFVNKDAQPSLIINCHWMEHDFGCILCKKRTLLILLIQQLFFQSVLQCFYA